MQSSWIKLFQVCVPERECVHPPLPPPYFSHLHVSPFPQSAYYTPCTRCGHLNKGRPFSTCRTNIMSALKSKSLKRSNTPTQQGLLVHTHLHTGCHEMNATKLGQSKAMHIHTLRPWLHCSANQSKGKCTRVPRGDAFYEKQLARTHQHRTALVLFNGDDQIEFWLQECSLCYPSPNAPLSQSYWFDLWKKTMRDT
jgi:hypothetical protein